MTQGSAIWKNSYLSLLSAVDFITLIGIVIASLVAEWLKFAVI